MSTPPKEIERLKRIASKMEVAENAKIKQLQARVTELETTILTVLDQVDYILHPSIGTEMVAATLPRVVLVNARKAVRIV